MKLFSNALVLRKVNRYLRKNVRDQSPSILRLWTRQCEFLFAQQLRRSQQILTLYAKIWEERALRELLKRFRGQVHRHAKGFLLSSAALLAVFDWDRERIQYEHVKEYFDDFSFLERLKQETIICCVCQKRKEIDCRVEGVRYCSCPKNVTNILVRAENEFTAWEPYIEQKSMITWRKQVKPGLYAYKVFVEYADVTAEDFLHVQTDVEYRKKWDNTAVSLEVIDKDPSEGSNSSIIYWEMLWPKLFANRDYVYNRRYFVDRSRKMIVIVNKSVQHPKCPVNPTNQRVNEYWSFMVIKPTGDTFSKPGLSFILTYFDNPGLSIPSYITNWVAKKQMPDFLGQLHQATLNYASAKKKNESRIVEFWEKHRDPGFEYPPDSLPGYAKEDFLQARSDGEGGATVQEANLQPVSQMNEPKLTVHQPKESQANHSSTTISKQSPAASLISSTATSSTAAASISTSLSSSSACNQQSPDDTGSKQQSSWWSYIYSYLYFI